MPKSSKRNKVFVDANVIIAATLSPTGGSCRVMIEGSGKNFQLYSCEYGLEEAARNVKEKFPQSQNQMKQLLLLSNLKVLNDVSEKEVKKALKLIDFKDAPVLASAIKNKMDFLISLDRKHFFTKKIGKSRFTFLYFDV